MGATNPGRGVSTNFELGFFFAENCVKMREIGPRGGWASLVHLLDPPLHVHLDSATSDFCPAATKY